MDVEMFSDDYQRKLREFAQDVMLWKFTRNQVEFVKTAFEDSTK